MICEALNDNLNIGSSVVTIGKFDGNHIGHQKLFNAAKELKEDGMSAVILTFSREIAGCSGKENGFIFTSLEKNAYKYPDGIDYLIECPFEDIRDYSPEEFASKVLVDKLHIKKAVVGEDFRFGKERGGNAETLKELGSRFGFRVYSLEKVKYKGREVSSTYIKEEIRKGDMEAVSDMLGEPFFVSGTVTEGKRLGNTIGFPTINFIAPPDKVLPPDGVYATKTIFEKDLKTRTGITNIGLRPTVSQNGIRTIETHIFEFDGDVYGQNARVEFYKYIRPEKKFDSIEALKEEIEKNKKTVREWFLF